MVFSLSLPQHGPGPGRVVTHEPALRRLSVSRSLDGRHTPQVPRPGNAPPMNAMRIWGVAGLLGSGLLGCTHAETAPATRVTTATGTVELPAPYTTDSVRQFSKVVGWPEGKAPVAEGFTVSRYATGLVSPRNLYVTPNGDVLVAEANTELRGLMKLGAKLVGYSASQRTGPSANRITLLRD